jgi:signal transduction histidine kinase
MRSITRTLLGWILGALALGALLVVLVAYLVTLEEMHEVFDANLKGVAEAVARWHEGSGAATPAALPQRHDAGSQDESAIVLQAWDAAGHRVFASDPRVLIPFTPTTGWSRPKIAGEDWIVYSTSSGAGVAQAAQRGAARQQMAAESAAKVVPPLVAMALLVGALLLYGLRRGLQPLETTARELARRSESSLEAIALEGIPHEFRSIVASINGLMARLGAALSAQRRFLADAAHELRTPVTALRLQVQLLQQADEAERQQALDELSAGIARSQRLTEQLLEVARTDPDGAAVRPEPVDLSELARGVVAAFSAKAENAGIDLGADAPVPVPVLGDREQLTVLVNNLVENALRYTPAGGAVDVIIRQRDGRAWLVVRDDGPGIPAGERERVFERFYRGPGAPALARDASGSGLGLAIVKAIAERHRGSVTLADGPGNRGLEVRISFL